MLNRRSATLPLKLITLLAFTTSMLAGNNALDFDGSTNYATMESSSYLSSFQPTGGITLEAWIYPDANTIDWDGVISYQEFAGTDKSGYGLFHNNGYARFWLVINGVEWYVSAAMDANEWTHIAGTYDGDYLRIYANGVEIENLWKHGIIYYGALSSTSWPRIGKHWDSNDEYYFDGKIDEARIWSDARTSTEINDYMHKSIINGTNPGNLITSISMNEGSSYILDDRGQYDYDFLARSWNGSSSSSWTSGWTSNAAPVADYIDNNTNYADFDDNVVALWNNGTSSPSVDSDGLTLSGTGFTSTDYYVVGRKTIDLTTTSDCPAHYLRANQIWAIQGNGGKAIDLVFDLSDFASYLEVSAYGASDYKLLKRTTTTADFAVVASGSSLSGDQITFSSYTPGDGYYTIGRLETITTDNITIYDATTATAGGYISANAWGTISAKGVCYTTSGIPTISDSHTSDGTSTGEFTTSLTGLSPYTRYNVRAYVTNGDGTSYGSDVSFTTLAETPIIQSVSMNANNSISVTWNTLVYNTDAGSGALETSDYWLTLTGGSATLASNAPSSISQDGTTYTLGISLSGSPDGNEVITVVPKSNQVFNVNGVVASTTQSNNTANLNPAPTIQSVSLAADNSTIAVTMSESVYSTDGGSGALEASDYVLSINGGTATLVSTVPSSISTDGNTYTLGISLDGYADGNEVLTVTPKTNHVFNAAGLVASSTQSNNTANLYPANVSRAAGYALDLDGTDDYVDTDIDINHTTMPQFTFEAWVYPTRQNHSSRQAVFSHDDCCYDRGLIIESSSTKWSVSVGGNNWDVTDIVLNEWQHVAVVYDHSQTSAKFYLNGIEYVYGGSTNFSTSVDSMYIGDNPNYSEHFQGKMDEIRVWNDVRTATEIRENMCREVTGQSNLMAYYQMTDGSGSSLSDNSTHSNTATLTNMDDLDWVTSGAAIGYASVADYSSPSSLNLSSGAGDDITVNSFSGSPAGVHLYRIDSPPNFTTPASGLDQLSRTHYFGVFLAGGSNPTYTITYDYAGHAGVTDENTLELAHRENNADATWSGLSATLNTTSNTLVKAGQTGGEYILGSASDNSLPVELSSFTAWQRGDIIELEWITESEVENLGFILERVDNEGSWKEIASYMTHDALQGQGSTTRQTEYHFKASTPTKGKKLAYRLADVSYSGIHTYHTLKPEDWTISLPGELTLRRNYPNPFNPSTTIQYEIAQDAQVSLMIYNLRGEVVHTLASGQHSAGWYDVVWSGQSADGRNIEAGIYYARLVAGENSQTIKMLYLK